MYADAKVKDKEDGPVMKTTKPWSWKQIIGVVTGSPTGPRVTLIN